MKKNLRILSLLLALMTVLCLVACAPAETPNTDTGSNVASSDSHVTSMITITVDVVNSKGETTTFTIKTDKENLRGALEQESLIQGDESEYGLYIKTVNGETADYNVDGAYWALYEGEEMAMTGVDGIMIKEGGHYKLVYTKG